MAGTWDQPESSEALHRFLGGRDSPVTSGLIWMGVPSASPTQGCHTPLSSAAPSVAGPGPAQQPPHHPGGSRTACRVEEGRAQRQEGSRGTRCQQDQVQEGFLSQPLQHPTLKNSRGTGCSFLLTCPTLSQFLSNMFLRNHNMTQCTPSKHLAAMSASHVIVRVIFFKPPPQCFCFKELIFNGSICLYYLWKLRVTEGKVLKRLNTVLIRMELPVGTQVLPRVLSSLCCSHWLKGEGHW